MLEEAGPDITAFSAFPTEHWRQIWSNNPQERLNRKIRRRSDVVGIFPVNPQIPKTLLSSSRSDLASGSIPQDHVLPMLSEVGISRPCPHER